jgi:hypothetical protein
MREKIMGQLHVRIIPVTPLQQNCALSWDAVTMQSGIIDPAGDLPESNAAALAAQRRVARRQRQFVDDVATTGYNIPYEYRRRP